MGNKNSTPKSNENDLSPKTISQHVDYIATHYILTMNFQSLRKLYEKEYCDKLVLLTADILEKHFTPLEITYLAQRTKNGTEINELKTEKFAFFNEDKLKKMDIQNPLKKKRVCIGIAKFYIKIAHIFAAIVTTINPVYIYKDINGNVVKSGLYDKHKIPTNAPRQIYKLNICENRINSLTRGTDVNDTTSGDTISINPKVCDMNAPGKTLMDEPGIPELMELYYDDEYDYTTGKFSGMSQETRKDYEEDLRIFYNTFTNNNVSSLPENIKNFKDIKLTDYKSQSKCQGTQPALNTKVVGSLTNKLFADYAKNVREMVKNANENQETLLSVINQLFVYTVNPKTLKKEIHIHPDLNEENIHKIVLETRAVIMRLYLTCEQDYLKGIKIYEAIIDEKMLETTQKQIENLNKLSDNLSFAK